MKKFASGLVVMVTLLSVAGCNVGNVPDGMSQDQAKDAISQMSPEQKIRFYSGSPMPQAEKEKKYKEIEAQTGVKAADVLAGKPVGTGAGG